LTLIAGTEQTRLALEKQLKKYLPDKINVLSYAIDEGLPNEKPGGVIVVSSEIAKNELEDLNYLKKAKEIITAKRTISYDSLDELLFLTEDSKVLFVNDTKKTAEDGIKALHKIGIDHISLKPYYPGIKIEKDYKADYAITPGEVDKVPDFIKNVYNIGPRIIDFTTMIRIMNTLDVLNHQAGQFSQKYLQKIIKLAKKLASSVQKISDLNEHLQMVINGINEALLVYDLDGRISVATEKVKKILDAGQRNFVGRNLQEVLYKKELISFLMNIKEEKKKIFNFEQEELSVNKFYISENNFIIAIFKNVEETLANSNKLKRSLVNKGYYAKHKFDDIIGSSSRTKRVKNIARKLANTELTILIEGESGTGKELFASAIHNESQRKKGPFLAVNFSALPDKLVESELFGYEEGAFTGARKGGKKGLFEQANGGSIFLDEIGDISPKVQARLLRVIQEKEILPIGGNEIKTIDVRIIAATNKDLGKMVKNNEFREDLYYRLKMGYIKIPPLRERKEDIVDLLNYFIKIENAREIEIEDEVKNDLLNYNWYGNVRELKNTISYMLAVSDDNKKLTKKDIPARDFFQYIDNSSNLDKKEILSENDNSIKNKKVQYQLNDELKLLLNKINEMRKDAKLVGRKSLAKELENSKYALSEYQIRNRLEKLEDKGLIICKRGGHGTILSEEGKIFIRENME